MSTARQWLEKNEKRFPTHEKLAEACAATLHIGLKNVKKHLLYMSREQKPVQITLSSSSAISVEEFRSRHDPLFKIRAAIKELRRSKNDLYPEPEFRENVVKLDASRFRSKADMSEFDSYKGKVGGKTYWGHPDTIASLKREAVMQ